MLKQLFADISRILSIVINSFRISTKKKATIMVNEFYLFESRMSSTNTIVSIDNERRSRIDL